MHENMMLQLDSYRILVMSAGKIFLVIMMWMGHF